MTSIAVHPFLDQEWMDKADPNLKHEFRGESQAACSPQLKIHH